MEQNGNAICSTVIKSTKQNIKNVKFIIIDKIYGLKICVCV